MAFFAHGSTVGTNALITRRLPRTAVVATEGFRDVHEIRRGTKPDLWDAYSDVAPPYVRRRDRYGFPNGSTTPVRFSLNSTRKLPVPWRDGSGARLRIGRDHFH